MVLNTSSVDFDLFFKTLRRAARHIAAELDLEILYAHALEILSDFSHSQYLSILLLNENYLTVKIVAKQVAGKYERLNSEIPMPEFLQEAVASRKPIVKVVQPNQHCHFLNIDIPPQLNRVTCLPLIGTQDKLLGFITFLSSSEFQMEKFQEESLTILTTLIATTIDKANLFQLATLDGLTGLFARRYFDLRLQEEITRLRRQPGYLSLIMLDIDLFKIVNDTYGHQEGDHVLRELAKIITSQLRQNLDIPCRYGGEEFAIILPGTGQEGAVTLAERMRCKCEKYPFKVSNQIIQVTISAGIATMSNDKLLTKEELIKIADDNLYAAKRSGRNCVRF